MNQKVWHMDFFIAPEVLIGWAFSHIDWESHAQDSRNASKECKLSTDQGGGDNGPSIIVDGTTSWGWCVQLGRRWAPAKYVNSILSVLQLIIMRNDLNYTFVGTTTFWTDSICVTLLVTIERAEDIAQLQPVDDGFKMYRCVVIAVSQSPSTK
jgi:hypothetical protein